MDSLLNLLSNHWPWALAGLVLAIAVWLVFGAGPRRRRAFRRGQRRLERGQWAEALVQVDKVRSLGRLSPSWQARVDRLAGEAHRLASGTALTDKRYEEGLDHLVQASRLLHLKEEDAHEYVRGAMLGEARRLFAAKQNDGCQALLGRVARLRPCPEATFWQALGKIREGQPGPAQAALETVRDAGDFDPLFYLGLLHMRAGRPSEALRLFSAAHRLDSRCAFVNAQLGMALIAAGSDPTPALRTLQRALGPEGFGQWEKNLERAWTEGMPAQSFVRALALQYPFVCPLLGGDLKPMLHQARMALAQAHHRLGQHAESVELGRKLIGEAAPTLPVLRTLGLSLARLEQFDEAFKHLRAAFDLEEPKQPLTAGYLALCGALGKPVRTDDKVSNIVWAIGLLRQFTIKGDPEWAAIHGRVLGEARSAGLVPAVADVRRAATALAGVRATDPLAAGVYDDLAEHGLHEVDLERACLYCRAVQVHASRGRHDLDLFAIAFGRPDEARRCFEQHDWDFDDLESHYLIRWAETHPGSFPPVLNASPANARRLLLARSRRLEEAGQIDEALSTAVALSRLLPDDSAALDRLSCLHYRRGDVDQALDILADWQARHPTDHRPYLRQAVLEQQRGNRLAKTLALRQALDLAKGHDRADAAWLGARLALSDALVATEEMPAIREGEAPAEPVGPYPEGIHHEARDAVPSARQEPRPPDHASSSVVKAAAAVIPLLNECLQDRPDHADALACLAALRWQAGDRAALANQASAMPGEPAGSSRRSAYHYLAAVCHLQAKDYEAAQAAANLAASEPALIQEARYLLAWSHLGRDDAEGAVPHLKMVATDPECASANAARALLGRVRFQAGEYEEAVQWWQQVEPARRAGWSLDPALRAGMFLAGITAYQQGRFEEAAHRFRESGRLGYRDRRIGQLLQLALFKAGQRRLFAANGNRDDAPAGLLEKCLQVGCKDPQAAYLLALAYQRQGRTAEARQTLGQIADPTAEIFLQRGLLALHERQLAVAEEEFARARQLDSSSREAGRNLLLTRLSLGKLAEAGEVLAALPDASNDGEQPLFRRLRPLLGQDSFSLLDHPGLANLSPDEEIALLDLLRSLGNLQTAGRLLEALRQARPDSAAVREAQFEVALLTARQHLQRCEWSDASRTLAAWARPRQILHTPLTALHNLLGCAACLAQDFDAGIQHFLTALRIDGKDPRLHQNHALALEWHGKLAQAEEIWMRFLDESGRKSKAKGSEPDPADTDRLLYAKRLMIDALLRLAGMHSDRLNQAAALRLVEMAHTLQPENTTVLDRLFQLYRQLDRGDLARRALQRLQQLMPGDPNLDLYELELTPLRRGEDLERWIQELEAILQRHPRDRRLQERAGSLLGTFVTAAKDLTRQAGDQFARALRQVRSLRHDEVNWRAVHKVMRDLRQEFTVLRYAVGRALVLEAHPGHLTQVRELVDSLDRKIEETRRWQGETV